MASTTTTETPRGICKLPVELRLQIYEHVISDFDPTTVEHSATGRKEYSLPLLNTCHMIRNEALQPYLKHIRTQKQEAGAKQDMAAREILKFLSKARASAFKYEYEQFENLHTAHEALLERCRKLGEVVAVDEDIALMMKRQGRE